MPAAAIRVMNPRLRSTQLAPPFPPFPPAPFRDRTLRRGGFVGSHDPLSQAVEEVLLLGGQRLRAEAFDLAADALELVHLFRAQIRLDR